MAPRHKHYDTIIVGGRVAGAATALLLARQGQRVLVLERGMYGSDTLSTHALMRGGVMQLARWGVLDAIVDSGAAPIRTTTFHYPDESVTIDMAPGPGFDALYAPRRMVLDAVLADAAWDAGADMQFSTAARELITDRRGRVVGVAGTDADGRLFRVSSELVIGADGIRSMVARAVGAPTIRSGFFAAAPIYGYWSGIEANGYEWVYTSQASAGFIPTNDGETCVFVGLPPKRFAAARSDIAGTYHSVLASIPQFADRLAQARPPARLRSFPGVRGYMRRATGPGWALVGDAGYFKDPATAHGITDALRDAELLARAIERGALDEYQAERDRVSLELFMLTDAIASFQWNVDQVKQLLLALSRSMRAEVKTIEAWEAASIPAMTAA